MPLRLRINNLNKKRKVKQAFLKNIALKVLESFRKRDGLIDITFVGTRKIKALNKKYMRKSTATDVLSFLLNKSSVRGTGGIIADIYISSDMAANNAKRFGVSLHKELALYTIHGVLHILGYNDEKENEKIKMRKLEQKFMEKLWRGKGL